jgi:nucleoid DNA-binding protein
MGKLTIQDIAKVLCDRKGLTKKEADNFVNEMFDIIQQALERDMIVKVKGLGTFKIIDVDPRESVNVNTGERVLIDGHSKITFTSDQLLKEIVNKPFSQFETVVLNDGVDFSEEAASGAYVNPEMAEELKASAEAATQTEAPADSASMPLVDFVNHDPSFEKPVTLGEPQDAEIPAPVEEPVVEEKVSEPVSSPASESVSAPTPETAEVPVAETVEAPADEEPEEEPDEKNVYEEEGSGSRKWQTAAVALLVGLGAGYLLGNYFPMNGGQPVETLPPSVETPKVVAKDTLAIDSTVAKTAAPEGVQPADAVAEKAEEPKTDVTTEAGKNNEAVKQTEASTVAPKASETKPAAKPAETKPAAPVAEENDKYAAMDARVRTGAYRIVGTERVMKVKEGDNLRRIAQRTLGPDMECYIEVYNGLTAASPLKAGQEIKIPKLQLKKKKTQTAK